VSDVTRLVDELTTLLYETLKTWQAVGGPRHQIVQCGACRKKADRPSSVVHESDCPVHRLWQALEIGEVVVRANAEEICDLEDERDNALGKLAELTRTAEWVTARCESANARIAALEAENARLRAAGNTVSAHVYASFNPGEIPRFVRMAMYEFEQAEARAAKRARAALAASAGEA
jgi:hypothetical protein